MLKNDKKALKQIAPLKKAQDYAKSREGKCLSTNYVNKSEKLE